MNKQEYAEYLESDRWKALRAKVRRRARGWCERCKVGERADVHHTSYGRVGTDWEIDDLIAVCRECHEFLHDRRARDPAAISYTKGEIAALREYTHLKEYNPYDDLTIIRICQRWHPEILCAIKKWYSR